MTTRGIDRCARYPPWATTSSRRRTRSPRSWTRLPRSCRSRLPRDVEESRDGKIDGVFTPLPGNFHVGGVERVEGSTARARRGSARRIRRGPLAPGITGRPPGVRSASAGSNVRRGGRSTAKIEPKEKFPLFAPFCWVQARRYLARRLSRKARARFGRWGDSGGGSDGGFHAKAAWWLLAVDPDPGANGSKSSART